MTSSRKPQPSARKGHDGDGADLAVVPEATRGGEDTRRRGWFWHWNALVTQYAPLIGLKGVGLLNSYTVWTDRREESPHRGYAFPSQQSESDFYGEDRAELITINKILVALDLIEIRKEMVLRADPQGRRWKVPHNFYRVKDHADDFTLSTADVLKVAELAAADRAVYRYVRRVFSPKFSPIDADNVWSRILPEVQQTPLWQGLAAKAAAEDDRASARTRAGHAARGGTASKAESPRHTETISASEEPDVFFVPSLDDVAATPRTVIDSATVSKDRAGGTSVASINTGSDVDVAKTNKGLHQKASGLGAPTNAGGQTVVAPTNTTYNQRQTTTRDSRIEKTEIPTGGMRTPVAEPVSDRQWDARTGGPGAAPPADAATEAAALRAFESANDRAATPAERKLLRDLAERLDSVAAETRRARPDEELPGSGWGWLEAAVWEAVEAGSAYVAPRRVREIVLRWERDGFPGAESPGLPEPPPSSPGGGRRQPRAQRSAEAASLPPLAFPPTFAIAEVGLSNRQVWAAVLDELQHGGTVSRADLETWLRPAYISRREGDALIVAAPNAVARDRIVARLLSPLRAALAATVGVAVEIGVEVAGEHSDQLTDQTAS